MGKDYELFARDVLTTAVLAILLTAPLGAIAIQLSGNRLLKPKDDSLGKAMENSHLEKDEDASKA